MSASKNEFEEAIVFAEDLICRFFHDYGVSYSPSTSGARYRNDLYIRRHFNEDILKMVSFFSRMLTKPYYKTNYFPRGYNVLDFLHYCGRVAFEALRDFRYGIEESGDHAINSIASYLNEFISSGEFERNGGWSELKEVSSKLCKWQVFCSVVCIGNKYGDFTGQNAENASNRLQTTSAEKS
ncbi:hypothetical protein AVEN_133657-1 [Araneus ventricosus]|uniref:Uncharacterized protein n=1 Tax=Araneus ventricosus TaxID=182803 RepID=A0A4Y2MLS7_ARAVE|nr:hypothetical protein AVEN_133657-1 [Araneus ventricosus]